MSEFPDFYDPDRIGTLFYPDVPAIAAAANRAGLPPAADDEQNVHLLIIDMQVDFCHEQGSLYVPGAEDDVRRLVEFIFSNAGNVTDVTCTLDSHLPYQIFHPAWWADSDGNHPAPLTIVSADDVDSGRWRPLVMPEHSQAYVHKLEAEAKKQLTIWPYHVLIGGMGNTLDPELWSTVMWHSLARKTQPTWLVKGRVPQSEHYSAIQPEISVPDHPQGGKHKPLLEALVQSDAVFIAGEAQSHCVLETLEDIVTEFRDRPQVLQKFYVLQDCMSAVVHPEVDFGEIARQQFDEFAELGVNFVESTDAIGVLQETRGAIVADGQLTPVSGLERMSAWNKELMPAESDPKGQSNA